MKNGGVQRRLAGSLLGTRQIYLCGAVSCNIAAVHLLHIPDWLSLVERLVWDQEAVSSILASGTAG